MKRILILCAILVGPLVTLGQTAEEGGAIMLPITRLFTGMNLGDSSMVHSAFVANPTLAVVGKDKAGNPVLRTETIHKFLVAVGTPHAESWSEPIWDVKIQVDGNLAQVWTNYAFYLGKKFSHCGVDAFQLFKGGDGQWRIFHLADTRQTEGCTIPQNIKDQFK